MTENPEIGKIILVLLVLLIIVLDFSRVIAGPLVRALMILSVLGLVVFAAKVFLFYITRD